jgi:hypothetical protein
MVAVNEFEATIIKLTKPINGQYPRPWMTKMECPEKARIFIVGYNQAKTFKEQDVGRHEKYVDALFNRNGEECHKLYNLVVGKPSKTRPQIDALSELLESKGIADILETNVICYSTPMGADLKNPNHGGGLELGTKIFEKLLDFIRPEALIVFGSNTRKKFSRLFEGHLPSLPTKTDDLVVANPKRGAYSPTVYLIRSLALPEYNKWSSWAGPHLEMVTDAVAKQLTKV